MKELVQTLMASRSWPHESQIGMVVIHPGDFHALEREVEKLEMRREMTHLQRRLSGEPEPSPGLPVDVVVEHRLSPGRYQLVTRAQVEVV